jgi:4-amino-4-deoxy-L-arabinose transferase-like glycosyltransferase
MTLSPASSRGWLQLALVKFATVGVLNTLVTVGIIFGLKRGFDVADPAANLAGYLVGLALSFILNKRWTFQHDADSLPALLRFLLVFAGAYLINLAVVLMVIRGGVNDYVAHLAGMPFYTVASYLGCRHYAFRSRPHKGAAAAPLLAQYGLWYLAALAPLLVVLFYRLAAEPVAVWDEARLANNALEMAQHGLSIVTTYGGAPDHWNTKPPLLIWLMAASMRVFGSNEWALRLPSVLAALATGSMLFWFCAARLKRPLAGLAANLVLLCTPGFVLVHGARSGDYDSLLTCWTTGYLLAGYLYLGADRTVRGRWLAVFSLCVAMAFLTKTVQGLIFVPALMMYCVLHAPARAVLRHKPLYLAAALIVMFCVAYYLLREQADPGYFKAALANDLGGRYAAAIEHHDGPPYWYLGKIQLYPWMLPAIAAGTALIRRGTPPVRQAAIYLGTAAVFYLIVISSASTKLAWYATPLAPLLALLIGMWVDEALAGMRSRGAIDAVRWRQRLVLSGALLAIIVTSANLLQLNRRARAMAADELDQYSVFLRSDAVAAVAGRTVLIVHPGYPNEHGDPFYVAPTQFYAGRLRATGHRVAIVPPAAAQPAPGFTVVACGDALVASLKRQVPMTALAIRAPCGAYAVSGRAAVSAQ